MVFLVFVLGLFIGSFLNVCIYRLYRNESIVFPPSACPKCGRRLTPGELIPVVSFLLQRGRCRGCREPISWRYPVVEALYGLVLALLYTRLGWAGFFPAAFFYGILIVVFFIDLEHQIIPDRLVLALLALAVVTQLFWPRVSWPEALIGFVLGGGLFLLLAVVSKGGMGGGDIKLVAVLGFWFGWKLLLLLMFLSFVGGGLLSGALLLTGIKKRGDGIPFGPFLVAAAFVVTLWGREIMTWYLRLCGLSL